MFYSNLGRFLLSAASCVVIVAGMRVANPILVPFLLSLFIAVICSPALFWLQKKKVPLILSVIIIISGLGLIGFLLSFILGNTINEFVESLPSYQTRLQERITLLLTWFSKMGLEISKNTIMENLNPGAAMQLAADIFTRLSNLLTNMFLILLTIIFLLLEISYLPFKLTTALQYPERSLNYINNFTHTLNRYLTVKTIISVCTGLLIFIFLKLLGVDFPFLWALLVFLLNFVPNIGSIIAAIPPIILAFVQLGGVYALITAAGFLVVNVTIGNLVEPRFMGKRLGLSTLVVFLSLVFWGWVLGPVGMLLSVPLTMIVKIGLESSEKTRWIAILLGQNSNTT